VLDKAEYSAFESTLNSAIVSYRLSVQYRVSCEWCRDDEMCSRGQDLAYQPSPYRTSRVQFDNSELQ